MPGILNLELEKSVKLAIAGRNFVLIGSAGTFDITSFFTYNIFKEINRKF